MGKTVEVTGDKIDYLLKAKSGFGQIGYTAETLKSDLENIGNTVSQSDLSNITQWGPRFQKALEVIGPNQMLGRITTVWQVDIGDTLIRLITAIPEVFK